MFDHQATKDQVTPATNAKGRENDATSEDEHARDTERYSAIRTGVQKNRYIFFLEI